MASGSRCFHPSSSTEFPDGGQVQRFGKRPAGDCPVTEEGDRNAAVCPESRRSSSPDSDWHARSHDAHELPVKGVRALSSTPLLLDVCRRLGFTVAAAVGASNQIFAAVGTRPSTSKLFWDSHGFWKARKRFLCCVCRA